MIRANATGTLARPRLLLVTTAPVSPRYRGDSARLGAIVDAFRERNWYVAIVFHQRNEFAHVDLDAIAACCDELIVHAPEPGEERPQPRSHVYAWCPRGLPSAVASACSRILPDVVLAQFTPLGACLAQVDRAVKVLDADNVFSLRARAYAQAGLRYKWIDPSTESEAAALEAADVVLAIQERECEVLEAMSGGTPVVLVPHAVRAVRAIEWRTREVLIVGNWYEAQAEGLDEFVCSAWPRIRARFPDAHLTIAGTLGDRAFPAGIDAAGTVADLSPLYRRASIALNPVICGSGLKIKTVEALSYGKCLVTTKAGVEGLEAHSDCYVLGDSPAMCGDLICDLFERPALIRSTAERAYAFASTYFDPKRVFGRLEEILLAEVSRRLS